MFQKHDTSITIERKAFVSLLSRFIGYFPNPDDSGPLGPFGPVIRGRLAFGPSPEPWRLTPGATVSLNPQPLPPGEAFAAHTARSVIQFILASREAAALMPEPVQAHMSAALSSQLQTFIDDCGNKWPPFWKFPPPPPPPWWTELVGKAPSPSDLVVMGIQFSSVAESISANEALGREFAAAGAKLTQMGLERL